MFKAKIFSATKMYSTKIVASILLIACLVRFYRLFYLTIWNFQITYYIFLHSHNNVMQHQIWISWDYSTAVEIAPDKMWVSSPDFLIGHKKCWDWVVMRQDQQVWAEYRPANHKAHQLDFSLFPPNSLKQQLQLCEICRSWATAFSAKMELMDSMAVNWFSK